MINDKIIQSKPWLMSDAAYQAIINKVDRDLFYFAEESKQNEQKYYSHARVPKHAIYIRDLEATPEELRNIKTLEQLLAVFGYWIEDLKRDQRKSAIRLKQFFKALEAHHKHLNIKSETLNHYYLDAILLFACEPLYKRVSNAKNLKDQMVAQAVRTMGYYFSDENALINFLQNCPTAAVNLLPETLERLCEKHLSIARVILTTPSLAKKANKVHVAKKLFSLDTNKLVEFITSLSDPAAFLVEHRDWITGDHLLAIVPILLTKIPDKFSKDYLSDYLYSKKDPQGKKPIQKLQETISALDKINCSDEIQGKVIAMLDDNQLRSWLNLPANTSLQIAYHWEKALPMICQDSDLYIKTKSFDKHALVDCEDCCKIQPSYLRSYLKLEMAIEKTSGGFWRRYSVKLDNYFAELKRQGVVDNETALLIIRNERYWKRMIPAPAKRGIIWGWWRHPDEVAREKAALAQLNPIFARKLAEDKPSDSTPSRVSSKVNLNATTKKPPVSANPTAHFSDEKEFKSDMKPDSSNQQPTVIIEDISSTSGNSIGVSTKAPQTQLIVRQQHTFKRPASKNNYNNDKKSNYTSEEYNAYCIGYALAWFDMEDFDFRIKSSPCLSNLSKLLLRLQDAVNNAEEKFYEEAHIKLRNQAPTNRQRWEKTIMDSIGTVDPNPIKIQKELFLRLQLMREFLLNAYQNKANYTSNWEYQHYLPMWAGRKAGEKARRFACLYIKEKSTYEAMKTLAKYEEIAKAKTRECEELSQKLKTQLAELEKMTSILLQGGAMCKANGILTDSLQAEIQAILSRNGMTTLLGDQKSELHSQQPESNPRLTSTTTPIATPTVGTSKAGIFARQHEAAKVTNATSAQFSPQSPGN